MFTLFKCFLSVTGLGCDRRAARWWHRGAPAPPAPRSPCQHPGRHGKEPCAIPSAARAAVYGRVGAGRATAARPALGGSCSGRRGSTLPPHIQHSTKAQSKKQVFTGVFFPPFFQSPLPARLSRSLPARAPTGEQRSGVGSTRAWASEIRAAHLTFLPLHPCFQGRPTADVSLVIDFHEPLTFTGSGVRREGFQQQFILKLPI